MPSSCGAWGSGDGDLWSGGASSQRWPTPCARWLDAGPQSWLRGVDTILDKVGDFCLADLVAKLPDTLAEDDRAKLFAEYDAAKS